MSGARDELELRAADAAARLAAQTVFDRPLVLEAGAGTGKTSTLVARTLAWCLGPGWERHVRPGADLAATAAAVLERVTALTFTEAAASEMSSRVGRALAALAAGALPHGVSAAALPGAGVREPRARALLAELERLEIRTIHSWCRRILAAHALEAGLHPDFAIDADGRRSAALVREVFESRMAAAYGAAAHDGQGAAGALLRLARGGVTPFQVEEVLLDLALAGVPAAALDADPLAPARLEELWSRGRARSAGWQAAGAAALAVVKAARTRSARAALGELHAALERREGPPRARLQQLAAQVAAGDAGDWKRVADWGKGVFTQGEKAALGARAAAVREASAALALWLDAFQPRAGGRAQLDLERLCDAREALQPLLLAVEGELRARGIETFGALLRDAHRLLAGSAPACARIAAQIDQLLVDEFQDTDALQCDLLRRIALAAAADARPGLFLVGDPKQSIYGWREADLAAYERFVAEACAAGGRRESLCVNFRSVPAILDEVERLIAPVMQPRPGIQPPFRPLLPAIHPAEPELGSESGSDSEPSATSPPPASEARSDAQRSEEGWHTAARGPGPQDVHTAARVPGPQDVSPQEVQHWVTWVRAADGALRPPRAAAAARCEAVALASELVAQHEAGVAWSAMALLFRSRGDLDVYLEALRRARVPYHVEGHRAYFRRREVVEVAALLGAVADPNDHLALLTWLRSPCAGVPDAALLPLWERGFPERVGELSRPDPAALDALAELVRDAAGAVPGVPGLERVQGWEASLIASLEALAELRLSLERDPADRFVEKLRTRTCVEIVESARALGRYRLANLERFFAQLGAELCGGADLHAVLSALRRRIRDQDDEEEGRPVEAGLDCVSVRTIHQAKGLDFAHVYLVQAHKEGRRAAAAGETACRQHAGRWEYRLFGAATPGFCELDAERTRIEQAERVRTLYVALTRAKTRLVTVGAWPESLAPRPDSAASHVKLMLSRAGGVPDLIARARACSERREPAWTEPDGVRWSFLGLENELAAPRVSLEPGDALLRAPDEIEREGLALERARREAAAHAARPLSRGMSSAGSRLPGDPDPAGAPLSAAGPRLRAASPEVAAAVGTAIHRALESLDLEHPETLALQWLQREKPAQDFLSRALPPPSAAPACVRAAELWPRVARGALLQRLEQLRTHVIARELPVWLPSGGAPAELVSAAGPSSPSLAPVSHFAGVIDLLYRDPGTGELVIADYKTDRLAPGADEWPDDPRVPGPLGPARLVQARLYREALRAGLDLPEPPRFELWFLAADRIVAL